MENKYFNTKSPAFSDFRSIMDLWDHYCLIEEHEQNIHDLLDRHGMILFFKKGDDLFGAPEDSRIIFAKLKDPNDEDPMMPRFKDEAKFLGINLLKSMFGDPEESVENMFGHDDIPDIHPCDREEAVKLLMHHKPKKDKK